MKKSLICVMAMTLSLTASAYAANPFSDVPAGHWAYDSIEKLADAGVIEGYPDGTFGGDKLMTRYEMAQIVARAMASGANVDKLAAEFADELDALGVRVANLEKDSDAVKITGQVRTHYVSYHGINGQNGKREASVSTMRNRLFFLGRINDGWTYTGMIENQQQFRDFTGNEGTDFQRAFLNGRLGGVVIEAGRNHTTLLGSNSQVYGQRAEYVRASYGKEVKLTGTVGKLATKGEHPFGEEFWSASLTGKIGVVSAEVAYVDVKSVNPNAIKNVNNVKDRDDSILGIDIKFPIIKDLTLEGLWLKADDEDEAGNDDGIFTMLKYGGAKANKPGSWGVFVKYYNMAGTALIANGDDDSFENYFLDAGFEGYAIGGEWTLARNMIAYVDYVDLDTKGNDKKDGAALWSHLMITF